jgi:MoaA/NifB/PqqE/SkfB family radical SAM enzyme
MMARLDLKTGFICNNNCYFCVQADNKLKENRDFADLKKDLIQLRKSCDEVVLTGGEVTIRKDFLKIVKLCKKLGYNIIQIQTNGRMFSNLDFCKMTIEAGANEFAIALHGFCEEQHDSLTRAGGSFKQTIQGIKNLKAIKQKVITNTVVVKQNYEDLEKIAELLIDLGVDQFQMAFVHPIGNAKEYFEMIVPKISDAAEYMKKAMDIGIKNNVKCMCEAIPYCLMQGYESFVSENYIPHTRIRGHSSQNIDDYKKQRLEFGKIKFEKCKKCKYNEICEGPWKEYPERRGNEEFQPSPK